MHELRAIPGPAELLTAYAARNHSQDRGVFRGSQRVRLRGAPLLLARGHGIGDKGRRNRTPPDTDCCFSINPAALRSADEGVLVELRWALAPRDSSFH